jgi:hypothetical protein
MRRIWMSLIVLTEDVEDEICNVPTTAHALPGSYKCLNAPLHA